MNHFLKYRLAYAKGAALLLGQQAASYATAVNSVTPEQWHAMDALHRSGFFVGLFGGGAMLLAAFLSQAISEAEKPTT